METDGSSQLVSKLTAHVIYVDSQVALINPQYKYLNLLFHTSLLVILWERCLLFRLLGRPLNYMPSSSGYSTKKLQLNGINNEGSVIYCSQVNDLHYSPTDFPLEDLQPF